MRDKYLEAAKVEILKSWPEVKQETTATELTFCDKFLQALKMASGPYKASRDAYVAAGALILSNTKTVDIEQERVSNTPHDSHAVSNHVGYRVGVV